MLKKLFMMTAALVILSIPVMAEVKPLTFAWEQEIQTSAQFAGWTLYYSRTAGGEYQKLLDIPFVKAKDEYAEQVSWQDLPRGVVYFVLTARSMLGEESGYSNEVSADISAPTVPIRLKLIIQ